MNKYGRLAQRHWQRWLPTRYGQIQNPQAFFTNLGEQIEEQVTIIAEARARTETPEPTYLARVGQLNMARLAAEEQVMTDLAYLTPEPGTQPEQQDEPEQQPGVDDQGMPLDRAHPLWEAQDDPDISPQQYQAMLAQWHQTMGHSKA